MAKLKINKPKGFKKVSEDVELQISLVENGFKYSDVFKEYRLDVKNKRVLIEDNLTIKLQEERDSGREMYYYTISTQNFDNTDNLVKTLTSILNSIL